MSPGGDFEAYKKVEPYLKEWAAKAKDGSPCVEWVGPKGAGHYVKMVHNGIEQGQLSILAEAWSLLHRTLRLSNDEIKDIFNDWNQRGELSDDFLVDLGAHILTFNVCLSTVCYLRTERRAKQYVASQEGAGQKNQSGLVDSIDDPVVQDVDNSEGMSSASVQSYSCCTTPFLTVFDRHGCLDGRGVLASPCCLSDHVGQSCAMALRDIC